MYCINCGKPVPSTARFCPNCGTPYDHDAITQPQNCSICGNSLYASDKFCTKCGNRISSIKLEPVHKIALADLIDNCYLCDLPIPPDMVICPRCGARVKCFKCGLLLKPGKTIKHSFCQKCGHKKINKKLQDRGIYYRSLTPPSPEEILSFY
ncbi:MAG: zinc ribbon domain-containing protein [Promethearchaeota archaeon]